MHSLRFKLLTPFLLGSVVLTLFLSVYTHRSTYRAVEESVYLITKAQTKNVVDSMSLLFRSMGTSTEKLTTDPHVTGLFTPGAAPAVFQGLEDTENWFEILIQGNEYYRGIMILDAKGSCVASNSPMQLGVSYAARPYVKNALAGEFCFSDLSVGSITKNLSATAAAPVFISGEVKGAVVLVNDFPEIVNYSQVDTDGIQAVFTALLAPDGRFISHRDKALTAPGARFPELYARLSAQRGGQVEYDLDGSRYVGYAALEPTTGWVVVSSGVESEVFDYARKLSFVVSLGSLAALVVISFAVVRVANGILGSLLSLIGYAKTVSDGDLTLKLADATRDDELGVLHGSLQSMVTAMRTMVAQSQEASKLKSEFLANMSHEIRTPLNAVIGMAHLYFSDNADQAKKDGYIVKGQIAAKSLLGIINNILDISKIEAGMFELDNIPFSLKDAVNQVVIIHQEAAAAKGLTLVAEYDPTLPEYFIGDPVRIGQVLNNLAGNACKFTEKGEVRIRCGRDAEPGEGSRLRIRICVEDTGLGIDPAKLDSLFKPFTQADASITRRFGGTGLGLAISESIVRMMGGKFLVRSIVNSGTTFSFTILLEPAAGALSGASDATDDDNFSHLHLEGKRILVAEDNEINQILMEELLKPTGATVVLAANGQEAVEAFERQEFDLVLMDMQMPVMDGIEAVRRIRQLEKRGAVPVVAVTANAMKEDKEQGFAAGLNDYITKPIEPGQLIMALKRWLG